MSSLPNPAQAILAEAIGTFFLVFMIWSVAVDRDARPVIFGLAIGFTLAAGILAVGPITGAALNPARVFGQFLVALNFNNFGDQLIYWIGPLLGGLAAGFLYNSYFLDDEEEEIVETEESE